MPEAAPTCWTVIRGAAAGRAEDREDFARRYEPIIRAYLAARWTNGPLLAEIDDGVQEIFIDCFREGGVLERADAEKPGGFRSFLYGVIRIAALRIESGRARRDARSPSSTVDLSGVPADETSLSRVFDREWAQTQVREAMRLLEERAREAGEPALRRIELLRARFGEDLPIREIAARWGMDATRLHQEQTRARREFKKALFDVVRFQITAPPEVVLRECEEILALLAG